MLAFTLAESNGNVSGNGTFSGGSTVLVLGITGTYVPPNISLTLSAQGFEPFALTGSVTRPQIVAQLNGSGYVNENVQLDRQ